MISPDSVPQSRHYAVRLRTAHAEQARFIEDTAKRKVIRAGRRGGKTVGCAILAVREFLKNRRILYATPTEEQIGTFWYEVKRALREPIDAGVYTKNETMHFIERPYTQSRIRAKAAYNADTLRGDYADLLILDEFQLMNEDAWEVVGAPMLMDNDGDAVFIYTPPSVRSAGISKAHDRRYASKLYKRAAENHGNGRWAAFHFASHANPHISQAALAEIASDMTALSYRQEIEAEDVEEIPGALWTRANIELDRVDVAPGRLDRVVVAVDPTCTRTGDEAGIVVCGKAGDHYYLIEDLSRQSSPDQWAQIAVEAFKRHNADRIIYETNQGGEMVEHTIKTVDRFVPLRGVHASRGKITRAEPVAALAEQHKIHHVGMFNKLEDELCSYTGESGQASPNRLDAFVYAITELHKRAPVTISAH